MNYQEFIKSKIRRLQPMGFDVDDLNTNLFDFQRDIVKWALKRGRAAIFADTGLGKSLMQLVYADHVRRKTKKPVVIHCPVGVRHQTKDEAEKFGVDNVFIANRAVDIVMDGINLVNYEKLHLFDSSIWGGVVLDESSILKGLDGKTRIALTEAYSQTPFRLCCTATPAPNDSTELCNHAEFLGIMPRIEMLAKWFIHDSGDTSKWRLKGHANKEFWKWMAQWSVCISSPSDLGYPSDKYNLPELIETDHIVEAPHDGQDTLFNLDALSATTIHNEKRKTTDMRAAKVAEIIANNPNEKWLIWCDTNYEQDALEAAIGSNFVSIRGSTSDDKKEVLEREWRNGTGVLITKPSIFGFGMNWQHCCNMVFVGLSYSFESYYQAVRRCWRFGQQNPVNVHIVSSESEFAIRDAVFRKKEDFRVMRCSMAEAMQSVSRSEICGETVLPCQEVKTKAPIPAWIA